MRAPLRTIAIALPLIGLAHGWQSTRQSAAQGTEWDVAVAGYDPRDVLRGHYVRFRYVWPLKPGADQAMAIPDSPATRLCLEGTAPVIRRVTMMSASDQAADCQGIASLPGRADQQPGATLAPEEGRLFIPQADAARMESALNDPKQQAVLRFRLKPDGKIIPLRLSFHPRPAANTAP